MSIKDYILVIGIIVLGLISLLLVFSGFSRYITKSDIFLAFSIIVTTAIFSSLFLSGFSLNKKYPKAYNVAIIGFPKTGKTTLLTKLLGEILYNRINSWKAVISGEATINKLNENLNKIKKGEPVGATTDETKFAYRTNLSVGSVFKEYYKVEIGDFPGEDSQEFSTNPSWLKDHTNFFHWAIEADAFVFVIDVSVCFIPGDYFPYSISDIITGYVAAWQHILDANPDRINKLRKFPITLAFTKCDIIEDTDILYHSATGEVMELMLEHKDKYFWDTLINKMGIGDPNDFKQPATIYKNINAQNILAEIVYKNFSDLISYFKKENPNTKIIFTSAFVEEDDGTMLGSKSLLNNILPK